MQRVAELLLDVDFLTKVGKVKIVMGRLNKSLECFR